MWPKRSKQQKARIERDGVESHEALHLSQKDLHEIKAREPKVENVANDMLHIRQRNHFSEQLYKVIVRPKGGAA